MSDESNKKDSEAGVENASSIVPRNNLEIALAYLANNPIFDKLDAVGALMEKVQTIVKNVDLGKLQPIFNGISILSQTLIEVQEANKLREQKYPELANNLLEYAAHSWFVSSILDFQSYEALGFAIDGVTDPEKRIMAIETAFSICYRENFSWLGEVLIEKIPSREFAIKPAINAHNRGEYALSVPVFLSQAEGILRDRTLSELFTKKDRVSEFAKAERAKVVSDESWLSYSDDAYWVQLSGDLPIGWGPADRAKNNYTGINRNTVLHGIDNSYATETNSLKAFSLLCHVVGVLEVLDVDNETDNGKDG